MTDNHKLQVCLFLGKFLAEQGHRNGFHHLAVLLYLSALGPMTQEWPQTLSTFALVA